MKRPSNSAVFDPRAGLLVATAILALASLFAGGAVQAAEWRLEPIIRAGYEYDDNATVRVSPSAIDEIQGYILEGIATIGYATERTTFDITPRLRSRNYDEEIYDSNDGFLKFDLNHDGLKSDLRIRGNYTDESVRTAEREDADPGVDDPDEITGDDSGRLFSFGRRQRLWIAPQWRYDFSERSAIAAKVIYTDMDYEDIIAGSHTPYTDARLEASLIRGFSTRTRAYVKASARRYERDDQPVGAPKEVDGYTYSIGLERGLTETTRFRAEIGVEESKPEIGESDTNAVWDFNLRNKLETVTVLAQVKRSINASGTGRISLRDSFNLSLKKQFSERTEGGLGIRAYTTEQLKGDSDTFDERDYAQFRAQLAYALSRTLWVEADYRYTWIDRSTASGSGKANSIVLWFNYKPTAMTASR
jgi:hypothetical protein